MLTWAAQQAFTTPVIMLSWFCMIGLVMMDLWAKFCKETEAGNDIWHILQFDKVTETPQPKLELIDEAPIFMALALDLVFIIMAFLMQSRFFS